MSPVRDDDSEGRRGRFFWRHEGREGTLAFAVDPSKGARLVEASVAGRNLLTGPEVNAQNYGSTMWTAPQAVWEWPPPAELDEHPYEASVEEGLLVCRGPVSRRLGVSFTKTFGVRRETGALVMRTVAQNHARVPTKLGLWEVSRVRPGGLTFFPRGEGIYPPSKLVTQEMGGMVWFAYDAATIGDHHKLFADGGEGWLGHVDGRSLLVKRFPKIARSSQAPGEAEIELYADPGHTYVEIEQQGEYVLLPPRGNTSWEVTWRLASLPTDVPATMGDAKLVAFARALVSG